MAHLDNLKLSAPMLSTTSLLNTLGVDRLASDNKVILVRRGGDKDKLEVFDDQVGSGLSAINAAACAVLESKGMPVTSQYCHTTREVRVLDFLIEEGCGDLTGYNAFNGDSKLEFTDLNPNWEEEDVDANLFTVDEDNCLLIPKSGLHKISIGRGGSCILPVLADKILNQVGAGVIICFVPPTNAMQIKTFETVAARHGLKRQNDGSYYKQPVKQDFFHGLCKGPECYSLFQEIFSFLSKSENTDMGEILRICLAKPAAYMEMTTPERVVAVAPARRVIASSVCAPPMPEITELSEYFMEQVQIITWKYGGNQNLIILHCEDEGWTRTFSQTYPDKKNMTFGAVTRGNLMAIARRVKDGGDLVENFAAAINLLKEENGAPGAAEHLLLYCICKTWAHWCLPAANAGQNTWWNHPGALNALQRN